MDHWITESLRKNYISYSNIGLHGMQMLAYIINDLYLAAVGSIIIVWRDESVQITPQPKLAFSNTFDNPGP